MSQVTLKGNPVKIFGHLPQVGSVAKDFLLVRADLSEVSLKNFEGKKKIISIFPSVDTGVCAASVRKFNVEASKIPNTVILNVSFDLPFALGRFCAAEGISHLEVLSCFRSTFAEDYGVKILDSPLKGLCSRAVLALNENNEVIYLEQVSEITKEPNYVEVLKKLT